MLRFDLGKHTYKAYPEKGCYIISNSLLPRLDIVNSVKSYDYLLHQSLDKSFCECCSSSNSSGQFKKFRRDTQYNTDWKSIINPILEQEPVLSRHFSKEEFAKLSLLWISVLAGYEKSAELLVRSGADVNEPFRRHDPQLIDEKWTVLYVLLQKHPYSPENERLIRLVVEHSTDMQAQDGIGKTVLHYALSMPVECRVQVTKMLLEKGADVNVADYSGEPPLLSAASKRQANELLMLLMKHGANVFVKDRQRMNILHRLAYFYFSENVAEVAKIFIEKGVSLDDTADSVLNQPLHLAAGSGNDELVKLFLDHGAHVNVQNADGESPLYCAAQNCKCSKAVTQTLLKGGANINLRAINGQTALHAACNSSAQTELPPIQIADYRDEIVVSITATIELLLSAGADVLAQDSVGNTPLALISISSGENAEVPGTRLLIKALALKKACQPSIELKDEIIIERHPTLQNYYRDCTEEIDRMKSTRFIHTCTFFELFSKSYCQIAALMRNPNFKTKFKQYDLSRFSNYAEDILRTFERAQDLYQPMLKQEHVINEAVYNILPHLVVEKVVHYIFDCSKNS